MDKKPLNDDQIQTESTFDTFIQCILRDDFPEMQDSQAFNDLHSAWSRFQDEMEKHYDTSPIWKG